MIQANREIMQLKTEEHIQEIAFLYESRAHLLRFPVNDWEALVEIETSMSDRGDEIKKLGKMAIRKTRSYLESDDAHELFAAAYTLLRINPALYFKDIADTVVEAAPDKICCLVDAVRLAAVPDQAGYLLPLVSNTNPSLHLFILSLVADARIAHPDFVELIGKNLLSPHKELLLAAIHAQANLHNNELIQTIGRLVFHDDSEVQETALMALLFCGKTKAYQMLRQKCSGELLAHSRCYIYLAFEGTKSDLDIFSRHISEPNVALALGFHGYSEAIPLLIDQLESEDKQLHVAAAQALHCITNAQFSSEALEESFAKFEQQLDAEEESETESEIGEEAEAESDRESEQRTDSEADVAIEQPAVTEQNAYRKSNEKQEYWKEQEFASCVLRRSPCLSKALWVKWWNKNYRQFSSERRWRRGKLLSVMTMIEQMADSSLSDQIRQLIYQELVIRSREDIPFQSDWLVAEQKQSLMKWQEWAKQKAQELRGKQS